MKAYFNYIEPITLSKNIAKLCYHSGECLDDIQRCMQLPNVKKELAKIDSRQLQRELSEYGCWYENELTNHTENLERILWIAAGNIIEKII